MANNGSVVMANNGRGKGILGLEPRDTYLLFGAISAVLILSLSLNIFYCVTQLCSGRRACRPRGRQRQSTRQMEENPIYGNLSFVETNVAVFTKAEPSRDKQRVNSDSQSKTQDCYANLTLKAPRVQSGRSSPQIHYSDVVQLEEPTNEDEGDTNTISNMSDLYASVQTQHAKTIDDADGGEGYANHL